MRLSRGSLAPALLLLLAPLAACSDAEGELAGASAPVVRDSAGVTIVENSAPAWSEGEGWTVAEAPEVEIGTLDGPEAYQLSQVSAVRRLSDGRIVVADNGASNLRAFDAEGRHLWSAGRKGEGPGEFRYLSGLFVTPGDSVAVPDLTATRVSLFGPGGELGRTVSLAGATGDRLPSVDGVFGDGSLAVSGSVSTMMRGGAKVPERDTFPVLRVSRTGEVRDTLARVAGGETVAITAGQMAVSTTIPFGRDTYRAVHGDRLYLADSERWEVEERDADGALLRRLRRPWTPEPLDEAVVEAHRRRRLERAEAAPDHFRDVQRRMAEEIPYPGTASAFAGLLVDAAGNLWLRRHDDPTDPDAPPVWDVLRGEDGAWLGAVTTPAGLRVEEVGEDYVLGVWTDELDVPHVRLHRLAKAPADA